ncbi:MAG TPA: HAD hydrolase-like protein [Gemmatimonadales bacterium]|nr:HAD hydrolase-like protein [Gemmatimonadales bacterium]
MRLRDGQRGVKRKLVLFDIDGTLLISAGAGRRSILAAVGDHIGAARPGPIRFDGKTDPQIVAEILAGAGHSDPDEPVRVATVLERYVRHLELDLQTNGHRTRLMPGIPLLLDALEADAGVLLGLLTGNVLAGARLKLRAAGLDPDRFPVGAFGSDHAERPRLPAIAAGRAEPLFGRRPSGRDVVIIGDTPADVRCADSIGARTVAVATGGFTVEELASAGADAVLADFADTARALEAILF